MDIKTILNAGELKRITIAITSDKYFKIKY